MNIFLLVIALLAFTAWSQNDAMRGLVIFHRHGARLPAVEDYYEEDWPSNLTRGDLTEKGITQLYKLGKSIRKKYIEETQFLPPDFDGSVFKVRVAQLPRCMLSLLSMLNGIFPDIYEKEHQTR